jgi:hypothetical protein
MEPIEENRSNQAFRRGIQARRKYPLHVHIGERLASEDPTQEDEIAD